MPFRSILISFVAALGLGLVFVACGGDDDNSASTSASATATASASDSPESSGTPKSATPKTSATTKPTATSGGSTDDASPTPEDTTVIDDSTPEIAECELVSTDDLNGAVSGETFDAGVVDPNRSDSCTFNGTGGTTVEIVTFDLSAYGESGGDEKVFFESFANIFGDDLVDDPGDEAYYDDAIGLSILSGHYELDIVVTKTDQSLDNEAATAIAEPALSNMP